VTCLAAASVPALAADPQGNFSVRGVGALPCPQVIQRIDGRSPEVPLLVAWADGMLTQMNRSDRETFDVVPFVSTPGLLTILATNVCRANNQLVFATAVGQALEAVKPMRVRQNGQPVTITVGQASVVLRPETVRLVQTRLKELNLLAATPDGQWGASSRAAMRRFQEGASLPLTEIPDPDSVIRLMLQR
jgi:hypothetical protein